jgi:anti-anti-sigma factor
MRAAVVTLPAEIDFTNADAVGAQLRAALDPAVRLVVVDMAATVFCDCAGLHQLASAHQAAADYRAQLRLAGCSPAVLRVMDLTGLDSRIPVYPSVQDALAVQQPTAP